MVDIIIKNFPCIFSEADIKRLFKKYGSVKKIRKHKTKQEAVVTMPFLYQAQNAIKELDGSKQLGKSLKVAVA